MVVAKLHANHFVLGKFLRVSATASPPSLIEPSGMRTWIVAYASQISRSGLSDRSIPGSSPMGCTMMLVAPDLLCADLCTQCPIWRQTAHSSLNRRTGLGCFCIIVTWPPFMTQRAASLLSGHWILSGMVPRLVQLRSD